MVLDPRINPTYDEWSAVMEWMSYVGSDTMAGLATKYFFTRVSVFSSEKYQECYFQWYEELCIWLDSPGVSYDEVSAWYREWTQRLPESLKAAPTIAGNFSFTIFDFLYTLPAYFHHNLQNSSVILLHTLSKLI